MQSVDSNPQVLSGNQSRQADFWHRATTFLFICKCPKSIVEPASQKPNQRRASINSIREGPCMLQRAVRRRKSDVTEKTCQQPNHTPKMNPMCTFLLHRNEGRRWNTYHELKDGRGHKQMWRTWEGHSFLQRERCFSEGTD